MLEEIDLNSGLISSSQDEEEPSVLENEELSEEKAEGDVSEHEEKTNRQNSRF